MLKRHQRLDKICIIFTWSRKSAELFSRKCCLALDPWGSQVRTVYVCTLAIDECISYSIRLLRYCWHSFLVKQLSWYFVSITIPKVHLLENIFMVPIDVFSRSYLGSDHSGNWLVDEQPIWGQNLNIDKWLDLDPVWDDMSTSTGPGGEHDVILGVQLANFQELTRSWKTKWWCDWWFWK